MRCVGPMTPMCMYVYVGVLEGVARIFMCASDVEPSRHVPKGTDTAIWGWVCGTILADLDLL